LQTFPKKIYVKAMLTRNIADGDYHIGKVLQRAETKLAATLRQILLKSERISLGDAASVMLAIFRFKILRRSKHSEIP
ncbi:hypothetical protein, partial [Pseudomonas syringae]|uniref:hypothetical protein n=1 Tax=Pseudomonas syringae TaxID=317 RepID=UPI000B1ECD87